MKVEARLVKRSLKMIVISFAVVFGTLYFVRSRLISEAKPLRISKETTFLVDGAPGEKLPYLKTYLGDLTDPIPPEDDARLVLEKLGSSESISWPAFWEYVEAQQANPSNQPSKAYFITLSRLVDILEDRTFLRGDVLDMKLTEESLNEELETVMSTPWSSEDHVALAEWLDRNKAVLTIGEELCLCSRHTVAPPPANLSVLNWWDPNADRYGELSQLFACRAQRCLALGQWNQAVSDTAACQHMARLAAQCPGSIHYLKAANIYHRFLRLLSSLASAVDEDASKLTVLRARFKERTVLPRLVDVIDKERLMFLDVFYTLAISPESAASNDLISEVGVFREAVRPGTDWNIVMTYWNQQIDEILRALNEQDLSVRFALLDQQAASLKQPLAVDRYTLVRSALRVAPQSELISRKIGSLFLPELIQLAKVEPRTAVFEMDFQSRMAIQQFRIDHGRWPKSLNELVPGYLFEIPRSPLTGEIPVYHTDGDTFTLDSFPPGQP